ncbi:MAG: hypothetical protein ACON4H_11050 [Rubripirellula sp.]
MSSLARGDHRHALIVAIEVMVSVERLVMQLELQGSVPRGE